MQALLNEVKGWIYEAADFVKKELQNPLLIEEKSSRTDLVTNVDKATEKFIVEKIQKHFPNDDILGEEGTGKDLESLDGRLWIIDPIDGTMNFVKQHENFCIMLAFHEGGVGKLGFIYNVMADEFVYGGPEVGVYLNDKKVEALPDISLADGILGLNPYMFAEDISGAQKVGNACSGVRCFGCAGIDFIQIIKGSQVGYVSRISPWDYAAGIVLAGTLGVQAMRMDGKPLDYRGKTPFMCGTPLAFDEMRKILKI